MTNKQVQAIIFQKKYFKKPNNAKKWLTEHKYKPIKPVDVTVNYYRYRINPPKKNGKFRMIDITKGVKMILQY